MIDTKEVVRREAMYAGKRHTYMLKLNADEYVDSTRMGCLARFINHCCEPNCVMQRWIVGRRQVVPPPPPSPYTNWTRLVLPPVLSGHVSSTAASPIA